MKICSTCENEFPATLEYFKPHKQCKNGLVGQCRGCRQAYIREWKQRPENRDRILNQKRDYYHANKDKFRQWRKEWQPSEEVLERKRELVRQWKRDNPERNAAHTRNRKALKKAQGGHAVNYISILERDGYWCYLCETEIPPTDLHYDHVIPLSRGGLHVEENIKVTHSLCNMRKGVSLVQGD